MSNAILSREPAARVPSCRRHKPTGQAVVTLNGRDIYLGKWNTKVSRAEYDRLIGEWLAVSFDPTTGLANSQHAEEWDPWK